MAIRRVLSFKYALDGITTALKEEPHLKFHLLAAILTIAAGFFFELNPYEWLAVIISIGLVISLELTNTAVETIVDAFTSEQHPGAKKAKDVSAGAVLVISLMALSVGVVVFLPHVLNLLVASD